MQYDKGHLSFEAQADRLISRGLIADRDLLISRLKNVNYYRFTGYLHPFRLDGSDNYRPDTTIEKVWRLYAFDRRLRLIVMDAIERIEVSVRTQLIFELSKETGAFGYATQAGLPKLNSQDFDHLWRSIVEEVGRSKEIFVGHFFGKYGNSHQMLPLWMAGEIMSFGCMLTMYKGTAPVIKRGIARHYGIPDEVLTSWLQVINVVRNICAHHGRLWNRQLGYKPLLPGKNKYPQWYEPVSIIAGAKVRKAKLLAEHPELADKLGEIFLNTAEEYMTCKPDAETIISRSALPSDLKSYLRRVCQPPYRIFLILTIVRHFMRQVAPQSRWESHLLALLEEYPEISRWSMGFPDNWKESPLWNS
jgi:abortive infection bacteriophage resistance protein